MTNYRSWVDPSRFSDHHVISLEMEMGDTDPPRPFKFNHEWLRVDSFKDLIAKVWLVEDYVHGLHPLDLLSDKLCRLKGEVKGWVKVQTSLNKKTLKDIEGKIGVLLAKSTLLIWN